jgi:hypothetical protein
MPRPPQGHGTNDALNIAQIGNPNEPNFLLFSPATRRGIIGNERRHWAYFARFFRVA